MPFETFSSRRNQLEMAPCTKVHKDFSAFYDDYSMSHLAKQRQKSRHSSFDPRPLGQASERSNILLAADTQKVELLRAPHAL